MTMDPKAQQMARQLGRLLRQYVPSDGSGHEAVELFESFREGFSQDLNGVAFLDLPLQESRTDGTGSSLGFDLASTHVLKLMIEDRRVVVRNAADDARFGSGQEALAWFDRFDMLHLRSNLPEGK